MPLTKNSMLSPAAADLGLGAQLKQELDDAEIERRKKLMMQQKAGMSRTDSLMSPAVSSLFGGLGG